MVIDYCWEEADAHVSALPIADADEYATVLELAAHLSSAKLEPYFEILKKRRYVALRRLKACGFVSFREVAKKYDLVVSTPHDKVFDDLRDWLLRDQFGPPDKRFVAVVKQYHPRWGQNATGLRLRADYQLRELPRNRIEELAGFMIPATSAFKWFESKGLVPPAEWKPRRTKSKPINLAKPAGSPVAAKKFTIDYWNIRTTADKNPTLREVRSLWASKYSGCREVIDKEFRSQCEKAGRAPKAGRPSGSTEKPLNNVQKR